MELNMNECPVCKYEYINVINHIMTSKNSKHIEYIKIINEILDEYIIKTDLLIIEIEKLMLVISPFINRYYISNRINKIEPDREKRIIILRNKNDYHKDFTYELYQKFIKQNKDKWDREIYKKYTYNESMLRCSRCKTIDNININYIDGNQNNFLASNIEILCLSCKKLLTSELSRRPYTTISKTMSFAASHKLPQHFSGCNNTHGHEWKIEVSIRKRIDPSSMMVIDFKILKTLMKKHIIDILDHNCINDIIIFPTAENLVIWCWEQLMFNGLKGISKIKIWESSDSVAIITIEDMLSVF